MFDYKSMLDVFDARRREVQRGFTFLDYSATPTFWPFGQIIEESERRAHYFRSLQIQPGDRIALMIADVAEFVLSFLGAVRAGAVPVPMYPLSRSHKQNLRTAIEILAKAEPRAMISDGAPAKLLRAATDVGIAHVLHTSDVKQGSAAARGAGTLERPAVQPDDACFVQFTSGSTADPKGVVVTHANLLANGYAIMHDGIACDPEIDRGICWLPLYHDMGLIGHVLAPLMVGAAVVFMQPLAFLSRPGMWMEAVHRYRGTTVFGPNFAFALAARRTQNIASLDLSCLRVVGCGAEPIHAKTLREFTDTFRVAGLKPEAIMPCYGLAEATLAVTVDSTTRPIRTVQIDREAYERGSVQVVAPSDPGALELVSCGSPLGAHRVSILGAEGAPLGEGVVGEIGVQGPSVTTAYFDSGKVATSNTSDWLLTGDLGFMLDGELFVSGRKKDSLIIDGKNYFPQTFEWAVEEVAGVRRGAVVAFAVTGDDTEALVIVAEKTTHAVAEQLAREIRQQVRSTTGLSPRDVLLVHAGELPKTSSGKLQRQRARGMYLERAFSVQLRAGGGSGDTARSP